MLIALIDPAHVGHNAAHRWFGDAGAKSWATCPITENGVIRIAGHPKYPNSVGSPAAAARIIATMRAMPGHIFWNDDLSLIGSDFVDPDRIMTPGQVSDTYLLALAISKGGKLATFERRLSRLSTKAVRHGRSALHIIDGGA